MRSGYDVSIRLPGLELIHHNKPGMVAPMHSHSEHHLIIPIRGSFSILAVESRHDCGVGRMAYIPAHHPHEFISKRHEPGERLICLIDDERWRAHLQKSFPAQVCFVHQFCKELLFFLLTHPGSASCGTLIDAFLATLSELLESTGDPSFHVSSISDERIRKALTFAKKTRSQRVTLQELAKFAGMSPRNFNRVFTSELGVSPKRYLGWLQIEEAKRLLASGTSVTDTAFEVGFQSLPAFIRAFRARTGQLPSEYR